MRLLWRQVRLKVTSNTAGTHVGRPPIENDRTFREDRS
jgi:hypothetical protein